MRHDHRFQDARVEVTRDLSPTVRELTLRPAAGVQPWTPGAHLEVHLRIDGRPDTRHYSLVGLPADSAGTGLYRIAVKRASQGRGGSRAMWALQPGDTLRCGGPHNDFELPLAPAPTLLVAGGIGITPLVAMALTLAHRDGADCRLLYAARTDDELVFAAPLRAALGDRLATFVSARGERIRFDDAISALPPDGQLLVCGPLPMLDAARAAWQRAQRPPALLRFETFGSAGGRNAQPFWVRLPRHGLEVVVPPQRTLLDVLEQHGVPTLADCRRGECGLCTLDVMELHGTIDHRDVFLGDAEKQRNTRLCACVSRVDGGGVVLDTAWRPDP